MFIWLQVGSFFLGPNLLWNRQLIGYKTIYSCLETSLTILSLVKNLSISTCLMWSNWTRLFAMLIVTTLSQWRNTISFINNCNSFNMPFNHIISQRAIIIALYLTSAVEWATTACSLLHQVASHKYKISRHKSLIIHALAQSGSQYSFRSNCWFLLNHNHNPSSELAHLLQSMIICKSRWNFYVDLIL
jgi:hypothetical protein